MVTRRRVLRNIGVGSLAGISGLVFKKTASADSLKTGEPNIVGAFPKAKPFVSQKFTPESLGNWPSDVDQHLALYEGYINKANEISELLRVVNRDPKLQSITHSELRALKVEYSFAVGGVKNHETFFAHQMKQPKEINQPKGKIEDLLDEHFGSFANWEKDLRATAISARGWAWLAWDRDRKTLFNYIGDAQNTFPVWNCKPLVALDMYEHAYFKDYGRDRNSYISDFLKRVDWEVVSFRNLPLI